VEKRRDRLYEGRMSDAQAVRAAFVPNAAFFAILVAVSAIGPLALNIFMPSMPGLQREFGVGYGAVQLTLTLYLAGTAICQLIYGPLSDRLGRRPLLLAGLALFVVASLAAVLAWRIEFLIAARLLQAVGGAAGIVLARTMIRDVYPHEKSASVIAYVTMGFVAAPMVAPVLGGVLDQYAGWRASFWLLAGLGAATLALAWQAAPETHFPRGGGGLAFFTSAGELFRTRRFVNYVTTLALSACVFFAFLGGAPHIMMDVLGRTPVEYGLWFVPISIAYMAGNFLAGRYSERLGIDRMILIGAALTLAGGVLCLAAALSGWLTPLTLFAPMGVAAFGNGFTIPNGTAGAISVNPRITGAAAGWAGFTQMGTAAALSQLVGSLQASWPFAMFWFMAVASLLALVNHMRK
jgi:MFS transporter, DHA1 family, multidrug resistance protein